MIQNWLKEKVNENSDIIDSARGNLIQPKESNNPIFQADSF